jgi:hypothetical protein
MVSAYSKAVSISLTQPDALAQPDANPYAEPLAFGFRDGKPAAVANANAF